MNITLARQLLDEAIAKGLRLHGVSTSGRPAISFDETNPNSTEARRLFMSTEGLVRDLLRAAMIERCERDDLPLNIESPISYSLLQSDLDEPRVLH